MEKAYTRTNWVDDTAPLIDAEHLNNIESGIDTIDNRVIAVDEKATDAYDNAGAALSGISVIQGLYATKEEVTESIAELESEVTETFATKAELAEVSDTVTENATELSKGKADVILANASGESIHLTDSTDSKAVEFALLGKATQKQYSGKNLLKNKLSSFNTQGIKFTVNEDGSVVATGTQTTHAYYHFGYDGTNSLLPYVDVTKKYILSGNTTTNSDEWGYCLFLQINLENGTTRYVFNNNPVDTVVDFNEYNSISPITSIVPYIRIGADAPKPVNVTFYPMLSLEGGEYEPYVGGIPSPNPDYPQDITVSGADGSVEVKSLGKNLIPYPYDSTTTTSNGITWTDLGDGRVMANGTATADSPFNCQSRTDTLSPFILPAGTYILSGCPSGGSTTTYRNLVGRTNPTTGGWEGFGTDVGNGVTFTITEESTTTQIQLMVKNGTTVNNLIFEPMISLEGGEFEPYKESTTTITTEGGLAGINGVCDEIAKYEDGSGKRIQRFYEEVFDGSEDEKWTIESGANHNRFRVSLNHVPKGQVNTRLKDFLCTHGMFDAAYTERTGAAFVYNHNNGYGGFYVYVNDVNTVDEWKTLLASNPMTVYYELAEPIITDLSAEEIAELEVQTFYPTTNILNDEGCGMEITFKADTKNYIDRIIGERITALETALINNI